jgi:putative hydrolase
MHSFFSDGDLLPSEIVRRTQVLGNRAIAITDHVDSSNLEHDFRLLPGVELTHVPPKSIPSLAKEAKKLGAVVVVVHGETPVEPVREGTDDAACCCDDVDILAHPGAITEEAVVNAKENGVFLELSYRGGHCLGNGHVARLARKHGAMLIVDSDAHTVGDHMAQADAVGVARNSGLSAVEAARIIFENPDILLKRLK